MQFYKCWTKGFVPILFTLRLLRSSRKTFPTGDNKTNQQRQHALYDLILRENSSLVEKRQIRLPVKNRDRCIDMKSGRETTQPIKHTTEIRLTFLLISTYHINIVKTEVEISIHLILTIKYNNINVLHFETIFWLYKLSL